MLLHFESLSLFLKKGSILERFYHSFFKTKSDWKIFLEDSICFSLSIQLVEELLRLSQYRIENKVDPKVFEF